MKRDLKIGTYVKSWAWHYSLANFLSNQENCHCAKVYGMVVAIDTSSLGTFYKIKLNDKPEGFVWSNEYNLEPIYDIDKINEIVRRMSGVFETSPDKLRQAFAEALGVKDASGWKTGEAIIEILRRNNA